MHLHKCDHVNFFTWGGGGGGVVRLTAKPRYLLLLHRGNEKSNTVTALVSTSKGQHLAICTSKVHNSTFLVNTTKIRIQLLVLVITEFSSQYY